MLSTSVLTLLALVLAACLGSGPGPRVGQASAGRLDDAAPAAGLVFGVDADFLDLPLERVRVALDRLAAAGLTTARLEVRWADLEPRRKGEWAPAVVQRLDGVLDAMAVRGIRPILVLSSTPSWARQNAGSAMRPPSDPDDFGGAAGFLASRYAGRADMAYEIWDEPNQAASWDSPAGPDASLYTAMLKSAYARIKAAAPSATVLGGSLAGNDRAFLEGMYRAGGAGSFDALALHPACGACSPEATDDPAHSFPLTVSGMQQGMADNGEPTKPIWITAMGWSSGDVNNDEGLRADYLRRAVELTSQWPFLKAFVVYRLARFGGTGDLDPGASAPTDTSRDDVSPVLNAQLAQFADLGGQVVNVRDYGARGDGSSDDTAAVRSALAAGEGGTVFFPAGTYILSSVSIPAGAQVRFAGEGQGATVLVHKAGSEASMLRAYPDTAAQLEIESLSIDGDRANNPNRAISPIEVRVDRLLIQDVELRNTNQQAIHVRTTTYTTLIRDCWLHDFALHGPKLNEDTRAVQIDHEVESAGDVWFVHNRVEMTTAPSGPGNSVGGIRSSGDFNTRLFVVDNVFKNMGQDIADVHEYISPIDIYRNGDGSVIEGNQIYNSYYDPIRVIRSSNYRVVGNTIDGEGEINRDGVAGIRGEGRTPKIPTHDLTIRGNTVKNLAHLSGIRAEFDDGAEASDVSISGNFISNTKDGVYLSYVLGNVTLEHNVISNLVGSDYGTAGVRLVNNSPHARTDVSVVDNVFRELGAGRPVYVDDGDVRQVYVSVVHNYFENSAANGVTVRYAPEVTILGNVWRGDPGTVIDLQHDGAVWAMGNRSEHTGTKLVGNASVVAADNSWSDGALTDGEFGLVGLDGQETRAWTTYVDAVGRAQAPGAGRPRGAS